MKLYSRLFQQNVTRLFASTSDALPKTPLFPTKPRSTGEARSLVDYKRTVCNAGNGGNGMVSFLREYKVPFGGPDGGDGGNGGHIIFKASSKTKDLSHLRSKIVAKNGEMGGTRCSHGKGAPHNIVPVPLCTIIKDQSTGKVIHELLEEDEIFIAARGGAGGRGNNYYVTNEVRKPIKAEIGGQGERIPYDVEMRVMATAGLIGFPNVGKSTFLRAISRAKPKVAAYPFTTLKPHIGIVSYEDSVQVAVADIPGLIEGAHRNVGLGFTFLKHIQRCHTLFFVVDYGIGVWREQFDALRKEIRLYDETLMEKRVTLLINKIDLMASESEKEKVRSAFPEYSKLFFVSAKESTGLIPVLEHLRIEYDEFLVEQKNRIKERHFEFIEG